MDEKQIKTKLEKLSEYQAQRDLVTMDKQALIDQVLTPEIKAKLADIDAEFADKFEALDELFKILEDEIKQDVKLFGKSVKGSLFHAVFSKGSDKWDVGALMRLAQKTHPELLMFREDGKPSVSIRISR